MSVFFAKSLMVTITGIVKVTFKLLYKYRVVDAIYFCTIVNCPSQLKQNKKKSAFQSISSKLLEVFLRVSPIAIMSPFIQC